MRDGGSLWVMVPWAGPFLGLLDVLPPYEFKKWLVHVSVPLAVFLSGVSGYVGLRNSTLSTLS